MLSSRGRRSGIATEKGGQTDQFEAERAAKVGVGHAVTVTSGLVFGLVTLNAPRPLMVVNCLQDELFTHKGMWEAEHKIADVYERMGARERFCCRCDDEPHSFKKPAQDAAIDWLGRWLNGGHSRVVWRLRIS